MWGLLYDLDDNHEIVSKLSSFLFHNYRPHIIRHKAKAKITFFNEVLQPCALLQTQIHFSHPCVLLYIDGNLHSIKNSQLNF